MLGGIMKIEISKVQAAFLLDAIAHAVDDGMYTPNKEQAQIAQQLF